MKEFKYTIKDALGIHARPAGQLVKVVKEFSSKVMIEKAGKSVDATRLMSLMGLGAKQGDAVRVIVEGADEADACVAVEKFFKENL